MRSYTHTFNFHFVFLTNKKKQRNNVVASCVAYTTPRIMISMPSTACHVLFIYNSEAQENDHLPHIYYRKLLCLEDFLAWETAVCVCVRAWKHTFSNSYRI